MKLKNILISIFAVLLLDQLTKTLFTNKNYSIFGFPIINYTENAGAAFSILEGWRWVFITFAIVALIILAYYTKKIREEDKGLQVGVGILMGGVMGNLIDRLFLGYVRDFINFKIWPTFNFADVAMFVSIIFLVIHSIKRRW